jgi:hypothetical protein
MTEDGGGGDTQNPPLKMEDKIVSAEQTIMDQKKFHLVFDRIGKSCLISSVVLFVSLIIVAAVSWRPDTSSLVIGFVISLTLFMVWCSIYGVYGSKSGGLVNAGNFQVLRIIWTTKPNLGHLVPASYVKENPPSKMEDKIVSPEQTILDQKKIHLVLVRIGKSFLISSVVLFVSLIIRTFVYFFNAYFPEEFYLRISA